MPAHLVYTLRPDNTAIWLPVEIAETLQVKRGDKLTQEQFGSREVQAILADRRRKR